MQRRFGPRVASSPSLVPRLSPWRPRSRWRIPRTPARSSCRRGTSATGVAYTLFTPEATLFDDADKEIITHNFSPNPFERNVSPALVAIGPIRATWQFKDTSVIWGKVRPADPNNPDDLGDASTDPEFVAKDAIAWLKVTATGTEDGPTGGDKLTNTTFVQRLNTAGGLAPSTGCSAPGDVGHLAFVPYTADYFFYRKEGAGN
jgi:uncharacterized protein DUF3455